MGDYYIYSNSLKKLKETGLEQRINDLKEKDELPYLKCSIFNFEIENFVKELKQLGYYENIPENIYQKYKENMHIMLNYPENFSWKIKTNDEIIKKRCDTNDMWLLTGDIASFILSPEEMWNYKKFGFDSAYEFLMVTSAFILQKSGSDSFREGYVWSSNFENKKFENEISGDTNMDLRVYQKDLTEYETTDPFGVATSLRPEMKKGIYGYHSEEPRFLIAVMKYIEQENIKSKYYEHNAKKLLDYANSLNQITPNAEFSNMYFNEQTLFLNFDMDIPELQSHNPNPYMLNAFDIYYNFYLKEKKLIMTDKNKQITTTYVPEDADHLLKGIFYQAATGLGRTPVSLLTNIVNYRFSDEFNCKDNF